MIHLNKNDIEVLDMACQLLEWYYDNAEKATIVQLLDFQDKLSLISTNIAKITGDCKASYLTAYFERKHNHSIKKLYYISQKDSASKAEERAELENEEFRKKEIEQEKASYTVSLQLRQINKVLSACQQRISFAKTEKQRMESLSHDNKSIN